MSAADLDHTDWPRFPPFTRGRIDREAKAAAERRRFARMLQEAGYWA